MSQRFATSVAWEALGSGEIKIIAEGRARVHGSVCACALAFSRAVRNLSRPFCWAFFAGLDIRTTAHEAQNQGFEQDRYYCCYYYLKLFSIITLIITINFVSISVCSVIISVVIIIVYRAVSTGLDIRRGRVLPCLQARQQQPVRHRTKASNRTVITVVILILISIIIIFYYSSYSYY